jgi:hypothetical protein
MLPLSGQDEIVEAGDAEHSVVDQFGRLLRTVGETWQ